MLPRPVLTLDATNPSLEPQGPLPNYGHTAHDASVLSEVPERRKLTFDDSFTAPADGLAMDGE